MIKPSIICEVTNSCNLNCSFCYQFLRREKKYMSIVTLLYILKKYKAIVLQLTGGEITTHPDFDEIVKISINNSMKVQISTNGLLSTKL